MKTETKVKALARYLEIEAGEIEETSHDDNTFSAEGAEWLVLTDAEADAYAKTAIRESVWAFNPEFLEAHTVEGVDAETIRTIQENDRCESNNPDILRLIDDVDHFMDDAIRSDGRGHFLSYYDGEENETKTDAGEWLFIYRVN